MLLAAATASAQPVYQRTRVVDPTGGAGNYTTIQAAINATTPQPGEHWTIRIYGGTYSAALTLGPGKERIDLEGVDGDAVIIDVTNADALVITGGTATNLRNNAIRNLTIKTTGTGGDGIKIDKQALAMPPRNIAIENVAIEVNGAGKSGINSVSSEDVQVVDCRIKSLQGPGVITGARWTIRNSDIEALGIGSNDGLKISGVTDVQVLDSRVNAYQNGINLTASPDVQVRGCYARGGQTGVSVIGSDAKDVLFKDCDILADGSIQNPPGVLAGVLTDFGPGPQAVFDGCRIEAVGASDAVIGFFFEVATFVHILDCKIRAVNTDSTAGAAIGVEASVSTEAPFTAIIGGSISSSAMAEKETEVYDIRLETTQPPAISGTRLSKWKGPVNSAERPRPTAQHLISVPLGSVTSILNTELLQTGEHNVDFDPPHDPGAYRLLVIVGNQAGMSQPVHIVGKDWAGNTITDKIILSDTRKQLGVKPFRSVTRVIVPAKTPGSSGQAVSVGTSDRLGLYYPISAASDVLQQARKPAAGNSYTIEAVGTVTASNATIDVSNTIQNRDSFEWTYLATK